VRQAAEGKSAVVWLSPQKGRAQLCGSVRRREERSCVRQSAEWKSAVMCARPVRG
jgi:hypothetical protein